MGAAARLLTAVVFLATMWAMDLTPSAWSVLAIPGAALVGFGFAGAGLGLTTYMRSWFDFDYVQLAILPMFLFSATFFPLSQYPDGLAWVVRLTPLYQGVVIERALVLGDPSPVLLPPRRLPRGDGVARAHSRESAAGTDAPALTLRRPTTAAPRRGPRNARPPCRGTDPAGWGRWPPPTAT